MKLTSEQKLIQDMVRKFTKSELEPVASEFDKLENFPKNIIKKLAELGFLGIVVPEQYDGAALDAVSYCIIIEELSKVLGSVGMILVAHNALVELPILKYGNEEQKQKWLASLSMGETIGAFCLAEETGQDIKTQAKKIDGGYVISGKKTFITNGEVANLFIVFANVVDSNENLSLQNNEETPPSNKLTAFLIEREAKGFELNKIDVLGMKSAGVCNLKLQDVQVSEENILGQIGNGEKIIDEAFDFANLGIASLALGIGQAGLFDSIKYSKERNQFGHSISKFQLVQEILVEMKLKVTQAKLLVQETAYRYDSNENIKMDVALTKLSATDAAMFIGTNAIQVYGGYGYIKDYPVERYFRDAKVSQVWGGTSITQKSKIAKILLES